MRDIKELLGTIDKDTGLLLCNVQVVSVRGWRIPIRLVYIAPVCPECYFQRDHSRLKRLANPELN